MASHLQRLIKQQLITDAPPFLAGAVQYEVVMGSVAYGVNTDASDFDLYGFAIAAKEDCFPHLRGEVPGFDPCEPGFQHYQKHHIQDAQANGGKGREYDVTVYAIAKYFRLLSENNPNIIDSLFVPHNCVLHCTPIGAMVRDRRTLFLHKGCWPKFKGYAYGQIKKIRSKTPVGKRKAIVDEFGYDVKFAYHVVRLLNEVEQIMLEHDLDLQRNAEQLKAIRRGEWTLDRLEQFFVQKEQHLETLYSNCDLPAKPPMDAIRQLLLDCLEQYYGTLAQAVSRQDGNARAISEIRQIMQRLDKG
ncbi:MAG: nucleotidyltransferase domain-containing protein [Algicola sp.]|nr:nucleotidyltransferase domain-containing protein [Algicola sp.]